MTALTPSARGGGWSADRQRIFLEYVADGHTVEAACRGVGLSVASAYSFRRRPAGAAFALGWRAANLLAREHVADALLARAIDGQVERIVRPDGAVIERHRYDNRLAMTMLARLDRQAEGEAPGDHAAARLVAGDFDAFLDLVDRDAGPARAGLFVAAHGDPATALEPIAALARADAHLRALGDIDAADLDPADRARWTADQWARAEAAGLFRLAPPAPEPPLAPGVEDDAHGPQLPQHVEPVWRDEHDDGWRTAFPPPPGFFGEEDGDYGDPDYSRTLTAEEADALDGPDRIARAVRFVEQARVRDAWFAARRPQFVSAADDDREDDGGGDANAEAGADRGGDGTRPEPRPLGRTIQPSIGRHAWT